MNNFLKNKSKYRAEPAKTQGFTAYQLDLAINKKVYKGECPNSYKEAYFVGIFCSPKTGKLDSYICKDCNSRLNDCIFIIKLIKVTDNLILPVTINTHSGCSKLFMLNFLVIVVIPCLTGYFFFFFFDK
jgi:hypothetical protein